MKKLTYLLIFVCLIFSVASCNKGQKFEYIATEEEIDVLFDIFHGMERIGYSYKYEYSTDELIDNSKSKIKFTSHIEGSVSHIGTKYEYDVNYTQKYKIHLKSNNKKYTQTISSKCIQCDDEYDAFEKLTVKTRGKGQFENSTTKSMVYNVGGNYNYNSILSNFDPLCNYIRYFDSLISYTNSHLEKFIVFKEENVYKLINSALNYKEEYIVTLDKETLDTVTKIEYMKKSSTVSSTAVFEVVSKVKINAPKDYKVYLNEN